MASVRALTDLTVADLWKEVKDPATLWGDVSRETLRAVKLLLQNRMHEELTDYLHAGRYIRAHGRRGHRNGVYVRHLVTTWGTIPDLEIPRTRIPGFAPSVLDRYHRRTRQVDALIRTVFLGGLSTRQVGPVLAQLLHDTVSPTTVSAITKALDQHVAAFHHRPLPDHYHYLFLDAVSLRVKTPDGTKRRLALVAYGLTAQGHRELIDYRLVQKEGYASWEAFLINLACRGRVAAHHHRWPSRAPCRPHFELSPRAPANLLGPCAPQRRPPVALAGSGRLFADGPPHLSGSHLARRNARPAAVAAGLAAPCAQSGGVSAPRLGGSTGLLRGTRRGLAPRPNHEYDRAGFSRDPTPHASDDLFHQRRQL